MHRSRGRRTIEGKKQEKGGRGGRRDSVRQPEDKIYEEQDGSGGVRDMIEQSKQGRTNKLFEDTNRMINRVVQRGEIRVWGVRRG